MFVCSLIIIFDLNLHAWRVGGLVVQMYGSFPMDPALWTLPYGSRRHTAGKYEAIGGPQGVHSEAIGGP